jgi:hypothetical protein
MATHLAHNQENAGSNPAPAITPADARRIAERALSRFGREHHWWLRIEHSMVAQDLALTIAEEILRGP